MNRIQRHCLAAAAASLATAFACAPALAADPAASAGTSRYMKDRANCEAGKTAEDKATCLKEAGAAAQERKRHQLNNDGSLAQNATDRCNALPAKDQADCIARIQGPSKSGQTVTTSGSVAGGGTITETRTVTKGTAPMPAPMASAPR